MCRLLITLSLVLMLFFFFAVNRCSGTSGRWHASKLYRTSHHHCWHSSFNNWVCEADLCGHAWGKCNCKVCGAPVDLKVAKIVILVCPWWWNVVLIFTNRVLMLLLLWLTLIEYVDVCHDELTHSQFFLPQSPPKGVTIPYRPKPSGSPVIFAGGQVHTTLQEDPEFFFIMIFLLNWMLCIILTAIYWST